MEIEAGWRVGSAPVSAPPGGVGAHRPRLRTGGVAGPVVRSPGVSFKKRFILDPMSGSGVVRKEGSMLTLRWVKIREHERGLLFRDGSFDRILSPGWYPLFGWNLRLDVVSVKDAWLIHPELREMVQAGAFDAGEGVAEAEVLDLSDTERALVWVDGRLESVVSPGLYVLWTVFHRVETDVIDASGVVFEHPKLSVVLGSAGASTRLETAVVPAGTTGVLIVDGALRGLLSAGTHAFWKGLGDARVYTVDLREQSLEVGGQEILTADRVSLRLNALVGFRVTDPETAVSAVDDYRQALYRQAQMALRAVVGTRELDQLLEQKDEVAEELQRTVREKARSFGVDVGTVGIRDVILPGEMREILNRVTEAKKAAEAALVTRREETAAMRSQANTARLFESNPTLMRLRELEVLEKVAETSQLTVVLGEQGLTDRVVKLL